MQRLRKLIFESEPPINIKNPREFTYFRILRFSLLAINVWPGREIGEDLSKYRILITVGQFVLHALLITGGFIYLKTKLLDIFELGNIWAVQLMWISIMLRIILLFPTQTYKKVFAKFFNEMHLFYYKNISSYAMKTHNRVYSFSHAFTVLITVQVIGVLIIFQSVPIFKNYFSGKYKQQISKNVTYALSFYYTFPYESTVSGHIAASVLNCLESYFAAVWIIKIDLFLSLIIFNIWGHFKILIHELYSFPRPAKEKSLSDIDQHLKFNAEMFSQRELIEVSKKLKQCISYHRQIVAFTNEVSSTFGPMLFFYYIYYQATLCLALLECSQMTVESVMWYGPLTFVMFQQLIQVSVIIEMIGATDNDELFYYNNYHSIKCSQDLNYKVSKAWLLILLEYRYCDWYHRFNTIAGMNPNGVTSEKLKDAVYAVPWECMDGKNRRTVAIFLMNSQKPVYVKALGLAQVGVTTMAAIIKNSISYFMFLRTISK